MSRCRATASPARDLGTVTARARMVGDPRSGVARSSDRIGLLAGCGGDRLPGSGPASSRCAAEAWRAAGPASGSRSRAVVAARARTASTAAAARRLRRCPTCFAWLMTTPDNFVTLAYSSMWRPAIERDGYR